MRAPEETRNKLLLAAARLTTRQGAAHLTLDAVAREAEVSKGGLLHHFPTKDALWRGLIARLMQLYQQRIERALAEEPGQAPGRWCRAYLRITFVADADENELMRALVGAIAVQPALLDEMKRAFAPLAPTDEDGLPPGRSEVIRFACDGLWLGEVLGLAEVEEPRRSELHAALLALTRG